MPVVTENQLPWYALHVRSNCERSVYKYLEARQFEVFLPMYRMQRQWSDRIKYMDVPLFPGYLFCRLDVQNRLPVLTVPGIVQIAGRGKTPDPVAEEEIMAVQRVLKSPLPFLPWTSFAPGQQVVVESGPLMGVQGELVGMKRQYRLVISITLLQRSMAVEIDPAWVRPLTASHVPSSQPGRSLARS